MEKIGVVTITYNSKHVLPSFLQCIWNQTYENFVLYVIDNSSLDDTLSILKSQKDSRINILEKEDKYDHYKLDLNNHEAIFNIFAIDVGL